MFPSGLSVGMGVATMSINPGATGYAQDNTPMTNHDKLVRMVNPATVWFYWQGELRSAAYPGVFFAQSAGNYSANSCIQNPYSAAYLPAPNAPSTLVDGIMVVGAIKDDGTAATAFSTTQPYLGTPAAPGVGSNFGSCVDIWAPGNMIYSTWGNGPGKPPITNCGVMSTTCNATLATKSYTGGQPSSYSPAAAGVEDWATNSGWQWLSGTSMAAPHVAAAAAYVAGKYGLRTPAAVEAKLRDLWQYYGTSDPASLPIHVVHLGP